MGFSDTLIHRFLVLLVFDFSDIIFNNKNGVSVEN